MLNAYRVYSRGLHVGAQSTVLARDEEHAKQLHMITMGTQTDSTEWPDLKTKITQGEIKVELLRTNVQLKIEGVKFDEYIFHSYNGDM